MNRKEKKQRRVRHLKSVKSHEQPLTSLIMLPQNLHDMIWEHQNMHGSSKGQVHGMYQFVGNVKEVI